MARPASRTISVRGPNRNRAVQSVQLANLSTLAMPKKRKEPELECPEHRRDEALVPSKHTSGMLKSACRDIQPAMLEEENLDELSPDSTLREKILDALKRLYEYLEKSTNSTSDDEVEELNAAGSPCIL